MVQIVFLPMIQFTAGTAIKGMMAIDTMGLVAGWHFFDHAAHLGGMLFGVWWVHQGHKVIWENREPIMTWWHQVRNYKKPPS
jgi:rhomboid-like protein